MVEDSSYNEEIKRVFLTCFNKHLNEMFEVLIYCKTYLMSCDRMIDRNNLRRL